MIRKFKPGNIVKLIDRGTRRWSICIGSKAVVKGYDLDDAWVNIKWVHPILNVEGYTVAQRDGGYNQDDFELVIETVEILKSRFDLILTK